MRSRPALLVPVLLGAWLVACARPPAPPGAAPSVAQGGVTGVVEAPPAWRPGDAWIFQWTSGGRSGTKHVEVRGLTEVSGVRYYLVRVGEAEHYFTPALEWAGSAVDAVVEARAVPPEPWFAWPLAVGRRWVHRGLHETRSGKTARVEHVAVEGVEEVEVPAGRFRALRVVREGSETDSDRYWYVAEVRWYVRWVGRRGDVGFEERLVAFVPAPAR